jgi:hypothetical protein
MRTYIENKGTIIQNNGNCNKRVNYIKKKCNEAISRKKNRIFIKKPQLQFTKSDLSNILGIPSIRIPIEERLERDFLKPMSSFPSPYNPNPYLFRVSIPTRNRNKPKKKLTRKKLVLLKKPTSLPINNNYSPSILSHSSLLPMSLMSSLTSFQPKLTSILESDDKQNSLLLPRSANLLKKKKLTYNTPLPKTIRIHLGSDNNKTKKIR